MTRTVKRPAGAPAPFSAAIREAAARRGLSTRKLAAAADLGESAVRNFLKARADLTLGSADRLAAALNLRVTEAPARKPSAPKRPAAPPCGSVFDAVRSHEHPPTIAEAPDASSSDEAPEPATPDDEVFG